MACSREEADFANQDYRPYIDNLEINPGMFRRYHSPGELWDWRQRSALLLGDVTGTELLDFGCGMGEESIYFSRLGARVTAIDISEVGIASLRRRAARHRLDIRALEMRADPTSFANARLIGSTASGFFITSASSAGCRRWLGCCGRAAPACFSNRWETVPPSRP